MLKVYFSTSKIDSPLILLHCLDENKTSGTPANRRYDISMRPFANHDSNTRCKYNQYNVGRFKKIDSLINGPLNHWKRGLDKVTTAAFTRVITPHTSVQLCRE